MEIASTQSDFDHSVLDIDALTAYEPRRLPLWFRERPLAWREPNDRLVSDQPLVDRAIARWGFSSWLCAWGSGRIDGKEVFLCESETLLDPVTLADMLECGFALVEPSPESSNYTICFAETGLQRRTKCSISETLGVS